MKFPLSEDVRELDCFRRYVRPKYIAYIAFEWFYVTWMSRQVTATALSLNCRQRSGIMGH